MRPVRRLTITDQTVAHLKQGIREGRWSGPMPGVLRLSAELDVSKDTIQESLAVLEAEGLIISHGHGRRREVAPDATGALSAKRERLDRRSLRVGILPHEDLHSTSAFSQRQLLGLKHDIEAAGHIPFFAPQSQTALQGDLGRITAMIRTTPADVWVVMNGFQELMAWFKESATPVFAIGGRADDLGLPAACATSWPALEAATRKLILLGHRRIVLVTLKNWRLPTRGRMVRNFLGELTAAGIPAGEYNIPDWEETAEGFQALLKSLFQLTPPTAMIVEDVRQAFAVQAFLAARGLRIPRDLSLVVRIGDPTFEWVTPKIAHCSLDESQLARRFVRWLSAYIKGRQDNDCVLFPLVFNPGETLGPPPK